MCTKHDMALRRYGNVLGGKVGRYKTCKGCGNEFEISKTDQEYCSNKCYKSSPDGRVAAYAATKAYRLRNKEKLLARGIFRRKPLPESSVCIVCGSKEKLHRHHHNYENRLDVIILCNEHHNEIHNLDAI